MFERILVATDFSPSAQRALDVARRNFPGARLKLLHVLDSRAMAVPDFTTGGMVPVPPPSDIQQDLGRADETRLQQETLSGEEHEMLSGDPVRGILQGAQAWQADLIVMGTHGRRGLEHFFLGSVAERVVRESLIPILTVRDPRPDS
ncbi:universal stress protein UspA-like protein [Deinococcus peraridilitoris DSM 19664]|uniref:Universal stress protein UspA-like protein n=2 Tax=Deinococcus TaxID=1298 RepID=L0A2Z9_DEIPD|nr:universal stress protein UspA-like protein [Deinococcus peraridilitoris DSM 19664]